MRKWVVQWPGGDESVRYAVAYRAVRKITGPMEYVKCDICGEDNTRTLLPDSHALDGPLVQCNHCGLVYVNPRRSDYGILTTDTDKVTVRYDRLSKHVDHVLSQSAVDKRLERPHQERTDLDRLEHVRRWVRLGRLLDIGCSDGLFLSVAQRLGGFDVIGVEPNPKTAAEARSRGFEVYPTVLREAAFPDAAFDVVTVFHVIEHLPSPRDEVCEAHRILKPGGFLCVETPNIGSRWFRLLGRHWRQLIPDHYYFFTPETIAALLVDIGFSVCSIEPMGKTMSVRFFLSRLSRYSRLASHSLIYVTERLGVDRLGIHLRLGDVMLIMAQRQ